MKKQFQGIFVYFALMLGFMWLFSQFSDSTQTDTVYSYTRFVEAVEEGDPEALEKINTAIDKFVK